MIVESKTYNKQSSITIESGLNFIWFPYYFKEQNEQCLRRILSFLQEFDANYWKMKFYSFYIQPVIVSKRHFFSLLNKSY